MSLVVNGNKKRRIDPLESISFRTIACRMTIYLRICIRCGIGLHTIYTPTDYGLLIAYSPMFTYSNGCYYIDVFSEEYVQVADCMGTMPWPWRRSMMIMVHVPQHCMPTYCHYWPFCATVNALGSRHLLATNDQQAKVESPLPKNNTFCSNKWRTHLSQFIYFCEWLIVILLTLTRD